eukprot:724391-Prymnesium_polylepis.1
MCIRDRATTDATKAPPRSVGGAGMTFPQEHRAQARSGFDGCIIYVCMGMWSCGEGARSFDFACVYSAAGRPVTRNS